MFSLLGFWWGGPAPVFKSGTSPACPLERCLGCHASSHCWVSGGGSGAGGRRYAVPQSLGVGGHLEAEPPGVALTNVPESHPDGTWDQRVSVFPRVKLVSCLPPCG